MAAQTGGKEKVNFIFKCHRHRSGNDLSNDIYRYDRGPCYAVWHGVLGFLSSWDGRLISVSLDGCVV